MSLYQLLKLGLPAYRLVYQLVLLMNQLLEPVSQVFLELLVLLAQLVLQEL